MSTFCFLHSYTLKSWSKLYMLMEQLGKVTVLLLQVRFKHCTVLLTSCHRLDPYQHHMGVPSLLSTVHSCAGSYQETTACIDKNPSETIPKMLKPFKPIFTIIITQKLLNNFLNKLQPNITDIKATSCIYNHLPLLIIIPYSCKLVEIKGNEFTNKNAQ